MRYLIPEGEDGNSPSPLLLIHEDRLRTLLDLEDALRDIQRVHGGTRLTQIGLMAGLDVLAKAAVNPEREYERATLAAFDKLRSSHCRPEELSQLLANESAYAKNLYGRLSLDFLERSLIAFHGCLVCSHTKLPQEFPCPLQQTGL